MTASCSPRGAPDKQIKIWDVESGQLVRTQTTYDVVNDLSFFPQNNNYLISVSSGRNTGYPIYIWNNILGGYSDSHEVEGGVSSVIVSADGNVVVTPHINGPISFWIPGSEDGEYVLNETIGQEWTNMKNTVVAINPDVSQLVIGTIANDTSYLGSAVIAPDSTKPDATWTSELSYPARKLLFTGDGKYLVALLEKNSREHQLVVLNAITGEILHEVEA